ncbi:Quinate permease [Penicillium daleae]|uniref:Quinate transporter n=1 Tax=Penicillium daleae TaxID=63821 RepID=A0AAD6CEX4_9EURO|nr:Quinate permease [Penicillium daleae]KAJ5461907.1 Quinate permease [Penicillium daleae]
MTIAIFKVVEDRPTPKSVYNWRIVACAIVGSLASCAIGYDSAFIGTSLALPSFQNEFNFASYSTQGLANLKADIVSVFQAGAFFGSLFTYVFNYYLGRKPSIFINVILFLIGAAMNCGANGASGLSLIIGGRVLTGWGVGGCSSVIPVYLSEIAPPAVRGRLVGSWEIGWQIGGLVGFWINYGVDQTLDPSHKQWIIPFAVQLIPSGLLFLGVFLVPESPRWLLGRHKRNQAVRSLTWLRKLPETDPYILFEIGDIESDLERRPMSFWKPFKELRHRRMQWRFTMGGLLFMFQNASGINAINYYSPIIFETIGIHGASTELLATGIFGVVKTVAVFVWILFVVDNFQRRTLLFWGAAGGSVCMWILGAYIKIADPSVNSTGNPTSGGIAAIFFLFLWIIPYSQSWSGIPWVINSEMFPLDIRALGQASAAASNWFWNFIITRFTPNMLLAMGYETSKISLEAVDRVFDIWPVRKANTTVLAEIQSEIEELSQPAGHGETKYEGFVQHKEHTV